MKALCRRFSPLVAVLTLLSSSGRAELPPAPVRTQVEWSDLIVHCKTEVEGNTVMYRVVETWKGKYSPDLFYHNPRLSPHFHRPPEGYVLVRTVRGNDPLPPNGQDAIFFLSFDESEWAKGKLLTQPPSFVAMGGKIVFPNASAPPPPPLGERKDYASDKEYREAWRRRQSWAFRHGGIYEEYTVEGFKKAVLDAVKRQMQDPTKNK